MGGESADDGAEDATGTITQFNLELVIDVVGEEISKKKLYNGVYDAIGNDPELHCDVGNALDHRRCNKVSVGDVDAAKEVAVFIVRRSAVATWYHDRALIA